MNAETWIEEYKIVRYLRKAPDIYLERRLGYISGNLWSTDKDGNVIPPRNADHRRALLRLYADTLFEQHIRIPRDLNFDESSIRITASSGYRPPRLNMPISFGPDCFAKFGKKAHLIPALERGQLRIAPASFYADSSLNAAQQDEELEHFVRTPNQRLEMQLIVLDPDGSEHTLQPEFGELFRYMMVPNFYVWCCGLGYDARLFSEFEADCALIVHDKHEFTRRLKESVERVQPGFEFQHGPVGYYDPYTTERRNLLPGYSKHIKYLYQNEYRFSWKSGGGEVSPFFAELGPLTDIACLIELV